MESCVLVRMEVMPERIINDDNDCDCNVEVDAVECQVICVRRDKAVRTRNVMKAGRPWMFSYIIRVVFC